MRTTRLPPARLLPRPARPPGTVLLGAGLVGVVLLAGCSGTSSTPTVPPATSAGSGSSAGSPSASGSASGSGTGSQAARPVPDLAVTKTVVGGYRVPWGLAALPDGSVLVAERDSGRISRQFADGTRREVGTLPSQHVGEAGLLGLAATADGATVFAYYTTEADNRVVSMPFDGTTLGTPRVLLAGIPKAPNHNGGRLLIGPDGNLWIGTGDARNTAGAQDPKTLGGKILRIEPTGAVPADNPFPGSPVWSYGHRNVQGLAFDSTGQLWSTEFGQNTWDELNKVAKGGNHGWPVVEGKGGRAGFVDPQVIWPTDQASPSGLAIVDDVAYVMALRGTRIWQVPVRGGTAGTPKAWFTGEYGRLRSVLARPDGRLWVATSNQDGRGTPAADDDRLLEVTLSEG
jgi:aldose sugar dehydrogenase